MRGLALLWLALGLFACSSDRTPAQPPAGEMEMGLKAFHAGLFDEAIGHYRRAIEEKNNAGRLEQAQLWNLMGMAYRFKCNNSPSPELKEKEIGAFKKALEFQPDFLAALVNLGATYYYSGRKAEAAPYFRRALELAPQHPEAELLKKMLQEGEASSTPVENAAE
jgi:tetratricopeptide (TPR) repeat protein